MTLQELLKPETIRSATQPGPAGGIDPHKAQRIVDPRGLLKKAQAPFLSKRKHTPSRA
jgi:hypothetical protein